MVPMKESRPIMEHHEPMDELICEHEESLLGKLPAALLKHVLQVVAKQGHGKVVVHPCVGVVGGIREAWDIPQILGIDGVLQLKLQ